MATCAHEDCDTLVSNKRRYCRKHRHLARALTREQIEARWPLLAKDLPPRVFRRREK